MLHCSLLGELYPGLDYLSTYGLVRTEDSMHFEEKQFSHLNLLLDTILNFPGNKLFARHLLGVVSSKLFSEIGTSQLVEIGTSRV